MSDTIHCPETQDLIITHMLNYVPKLGWTLESLRQGVIDAGYKEGDEYRAFQGNLDKVLEYYLSMIDRQMAARLGEVDLLSMRVKDRVATAVMVRLRLLEKNKEAVRQSLRYLRHPTRTSLALKGLYNTVNAIWYVAGDTATDFNFYTKRTLLAGVYSATLFYWLDDNSEDCIKTRAYLSRRLDQVMKLPKLKSQLKDGFSLLLKKIGI